MLEPFRFHVLEQAFASTFTSVPALPISPESAGSVEQVRAIHPHHASFQLRGDLESDIDVLAPHARSQSVHRVVGQFHRFTWSSERHRREHWTENLLLRHD